MLEVGRFLQADTVLDGLNRYAYCGNNLVNYVDPTGNWFDYSNTAQGRVEYHTIQTVKFDDYGNRQYNVVEDTAKGGFYWSWNGPNYGKQPDPIGMNNNGSVQNNDRFADLDEKSNNLIMIFMHSAIMSGIIVVILILVLIFITMRY